MTKGYPNAVLTVPRGAKAPKNGGGPLRKKVPRGSCLSKGPGEGKRGSIRHTQEIRYGQHEAARAFEGRGKKKTMAGP